VCVCVCVCVCDASNEVQDGDVEVPSDFDPPASTAASTIAADF